MDLAICSASINWASTGSMLQGIGTIGGALAVVWAAIRGTHTFEAWRSQKLAERKQHQAESILTATYRARRALEYVRGPMIFAHELRAAEEQMKEKAGWSAQTEARQKRLVTAQALFNRIDKTKIEREQLDERLPMARGLFSEELEKSIDNLNRQFWIVQLNIESFIEDENGLDLDFTKRIRRAMYAIEPAQGETNEVSDAIDAAVTTIERICLPMLRLEAVPITH